MSKLADIRAAIVTRLSGVANVGTVQNYERFARDNKAFQLLYAFGPANDQRILGWNVRRVRKSERRENSRTVVINTWRISGYMSLQDADGTELLFDELLEKIADAFRIDANLGGVVHGTDVGDSSGIQLEDSGPVMFAGVLCHAARLTLSTRHYV